MIRVGFIKADGATRVEAMAEPGQSVLEVGQAHGLDMEGACEGCMACSTCHVILSDRDFDRLPPPSADEDDMLDITYGARETSRLACQIVLEPGHEGMTFRLPPSTRNLLS